MDAPLARGLPGKQVDDEVTIYIQDGKKKYFVMGIRYQQNDEV